MKLLLIRHAIAHERDSTRWPDDSQRPLTDRGIARFEAVARTLANRGVVADALMSSQFVRAWQTAEILHREADWPTPARLESLEFGSAAEILDDLQVVAGEKCIALVGHEPVIGELISLLMAGSDDRINVDVKKGGVICLKCDGGIAAGAATLGWTMGIFFDMVDDR